MSRRAAPASHGSHERWLVSYADFITLLFAFFVVLYASSKADQKKQKQVSQAIDSAFHMLGLFPQASSHPANLQNVSAVSKDQAAPGKIVMGEEVLSPARVKQDLDRVQREMEQMLSDQIADHTVAIKMGKDGLVISLREAGFFSSGSATPHAGTLPILREIAGALSRTPYDLRIEGHTDNVPIHNQEFDSNWELSSARSTRLARIFIGTGDIAPDRIAAAGYAEFRPVAANESEAGRAENRRVDLVVMPRTTTNLSSSDGEEKQGWKKITE